MVYQRAVSLFLCRKYRSDISGITTKAPCEAALMGERHVRIEISDFVMRTPVSIDSLYEHNLYVSAVCQIYDGSVVDSEGKNIADLNISFCILNV